MNIISILLIYTFIAVLVGVTIAIIFAAMRNREKGQRFRQRLLAEVKALRLSKMVTYRRISLARYIAGERILDIRKHIFNCKHCTNLEICDEVLRGERNPSEGFSFCPNCKLLAAIQAKQREAHP